MLSRVTFGSCLIAGMLIAAPFTTNVARSDESKPAKVTVEPTDKGGAVVRVDGQLFTEYIPKSGPKPVLWPLIGPSGKAMTRTYPIKEEKIEGEKQDHIHHRSFWFTHGKVNGVNFWGETDPHGEIVQKSIAVDPKKSTIVTTNDWLAPDGKKVCEDERTLSFGANGNERWIDFDIVVKATNGDLVFGDDKEGVFGVRVAGTMDVTAKLGGKIVNSEGQVDDAAWGKPAKWVDYHGPVGGETVGLAILNHPSSFRYPTRWHVRTYGLFTANPFGLSFFEPAAKQDGSHTIESGQTMQLRYRVILHTGDEKQGQIAEAFEKYSEVKKGE